MKNLFFLATFLLCNTVFAQLPTNIPQDSVLSACARPLFRLEQVWTPTCTKDALLEKMMLTTYHRTELICMRFQDGDLLSIEIPFRGRWRIMNITNDKIVFESRKCRTLIFDLNQREFLSPEMYGPKYSPSDPHWDE